MKKEIRVLRLKKLLYIANNDIIHQLHKIEKLLFKDFRDCQFLPYSNISDMKREEHPLYRRLPIEV
jgi:hypothetical protein